MSEQPPRLRASDDDRNRANEALGRAFSEGRIDFNEFDDRTKAVLAARYRDELSAPLADLMPDPTAVFEGPVPVVFPERSPAPRAPSAPTRRRVTGETGGSSFSLAIMGGTDKQGDWLIAPAHLSIAIMGGNGIDLTEARLAAQETVIYAIGIMGGVEILVPEDVRVLSEGIGIMGGFGISTDEEVRQRIEDLPADAPVVRVRGLGLMGGVEVRRVLRKPRP
ncbi:DUF1707 domain-containing protein [Corynebacterium sp. YIM 101645]|uniref:DUF1707 domain-containing protein n=1 Tax=Corynebacterium lemuris TaxID=1859292 RepID=A0ABT2FTA6_9CORY|nr:DUF1707 domain-containing protein [Corynebacterium lemuris]MCS5478446.1 DUF1707 domain-containing protein [Corynebacterium lemuris]